MSLWQIAVAPNRTLTSPGPGASRSTSSTTRGRFASYRTAAFIPCLSVASQHSWLAQPRNQPRRAGHVLLVGLAELLLQEGLLGFDAAPVGQCHQTTPADAHQPVAGAQAEAQPHEQRAQVARVPHETVRAA